jgi:hypothetical protein
MRQFTISARAMADFETLERLLKRRLALYGQEGEQVLRGVRDTIDGAQRTRTFYADVSAADADDVLTMLDGNAPKAHGKPGDDDYEDPGIELSSGEVDFTTGVSALMDTSRLKELMDFVKSNGGEFSFEKGAANTGTARWSLPTDLTVAGDRGKPVKASASMWSKLREINKGYVKKFQGIVKTATGATVSKADILQMSEAYKAKLKRDAKTIETQRAQADHPEELETVLGHKLLNDRQRKRSKAEALFKDSGYTPEQIAAGDFFDNDDIMDQIGSDVVGYPVATQQGIRRARRRLADRELTPEDYRRATYAALDRTNARMRDSQAWRDDHPDSPLARQFREAEERRTPGTKAFEQAEQERLDRSSEQRKAAVKWAKAHRGDPAAKAILRSRNRGGVSRLLRSAGSLARNTILMGITTALAAAVKFLSALPGVAADVQHLAAKGNALAMTDASLRGYRHMEQVAGMKDGSLAETFGAIVHALPDLRTGDSRMGSIINEIAAISSDDPDSQALSKTIAFGLRGGNPGDLWREYVNTTFRLAYRDKGQLGSDADFSNALRNSSTVYDKAAPGLAEEVSALETKRRLLSPGEQELVRRVAFGEDKDGTEIRGKIVDAWDVYGALEALLGVDDSKWAPKDTATTIEWKASEQVAQTWTELATAVGEIKEGVLVKILGATEGIAVWLRDILKTIMALPIFNGMFDAVVGYMDEEDYQKNLTAKASLDNQMLGAEAVVKVLGKEVGLTTEADHAKALADSKSGIGVPASIQAAGLTGAYEAYQRALYNRDEIGAKLQGVNAQISASETGYRPDPKDPTKLIPRSLGDISRPFGWRPEQTAVTAVNRMARDNYPYVREIANTLMTATDFGATHDVAELQRLMREGRKIKDRVAYLQSDSYLARASRAINPAAADRELAEELGKDRENELAILAELRGKGPVALRQAWARADESRAALETARERMPSGEEVITDTNGNPIALRRLSDYEARAAADQAIVERMINAIMAAVMQGVDVSATTESEIYHNANNLILSGAASHIDALVEADTARRNAQVDLATRNYISDVIAERAGRDALSSVLGGGIVVSGMIKAEEKTIAIELTNRDTGLKTVIKNVPNEVERDVDVTALFSFFGQNRPVNAGGN